MTAKVKSKSNVQLRPLPFNEVLQKQTLVYWGLALSWNGRVKNNLTITDAMQQSNAVLKELNPHRPLAVKIMTLKDDIILYGTKSKKEKFLKSHTPNNQNIQHHRITVL